MSRAFAFQIGVVLSVAAWPVSMGCNFNPERFANGSHEAEFGSAATWDAGVLLGDQLTTFVFPLDDPAVTTADDIVSIASSCDCTTAEACEYLDGHGLRRVGIRINILDRDPPSQEPSVATLAVELTLVARSGRDAYAIRTGAVVSAANCAM